MKVTGRRVALSGLATAAVALAGTYLTARLLERSLRTPVNSYIRDHTLGFLRERSVEGLSITFPSLNLSLVHRQLLIRRLEIRYDHQDSARSVHFQASVHDITLDGLDLSDIIWHRHLRLEAVRLNRPRLSRYRETADTASSAGPRRPEGPVEQTIEPDSLAAQLPALDTLVYNLVASWLPEDLRDARIGLIDAENASIVSTTKQGRLTTRDSTDGLALRIHGIRLDSTRHRVFESAELEAAEVFHAVRGLRDSLRMEGVTLHLNAGDTVATVRSLRTIPGGSGQALLLSGFRRSYHERTFSLDSLVYQPILPDSAFFLRGAWHRSRVRLSASGIRGTAVDADAMFRHHAAVGRIDIGSVQLDVLADLRNPGHASRERRLWPQLFAELGWKLQVDTLRVKQAMVRYGEINPNRREPAAIWFSDIAATVTGLSNDPAPGRARRPAAIEASARFMGQGALVMRLEVPIVSRHFSMRGEGRLESMPAAALNPFLLTSEGIRVTSGRIQQAGFHFRVSSGYASGTFSLAYDSLSVDVVDRKTRKRGFDEKLKTFLANNLVLRGSSLIDQKGTLPSAAIAYRYPSGETFWGGIWRALRSGMIPLVTRSPSTPPRKTPHG